MVHPIHIPVLCLYELTVLLPSNMNILFLLILLPTTCLSLSIHPHSIDIPLPPNTYKCTVNHTCSFFVEIHSSVVDMKECELDADFLSPPSRVSFTMKVPTEPTKIITFNSAHTEADLFVDPFAHTISFLGGWEQTPTIPLTQLSDVFTFELHVKRFAGTLNIFLYHGQQSTNVALPWAGDHAVPPTIRMQSGSYSLYGVTVNGIRMSVEHIVINHSDAIHSCPVKFDGRYSYIESTRLYPDDAGTTDVAVFHPPTRAMLDTRWLVACLASKKGVSVRIAETILELNCYQRGSRSDKPVTQFINTTLYIA